MKPLLMLALLSLLLTCEPGEKPAVEKAGIFADMPPSVDEAEVRAVFDAVNALREKGCICPGDHRYAPVPALRWDNQLAKAAQAHADDMDRRRYFSHTSIDGTEFADRISRAGYRWHSVGENIAKGYPTAAEVVQAWRNSKDHCPNLMNPKFRDMGIGKTGPYWVQDLGAKE